MVVKLDGIMNTETMEFDAMQTWFFDYTVNTSFEVREHSLTDAIGDNLVPEDLALGRSEEHTSELQTH